MVHNRVKILVIISLACLILIVFNLPYRKEVTDKYYSNENLVNKENDVIIKSIKKSNAITDSSVLCIIMTSEKTFVERSITVWNTWAKKCHKALFACNCRNLTELLISTNKNSLFKNLNDFKNSLNIPIWRLNLTENYDHMADKVFTIVKSAYADYGHLYKWFLLTDDDTYTFVDNLHSFVSKKSYKEPVTYGYNYKVIVPVFELILISSRYYLLIA